ncbi:uncharacterized protein TNCT_732601 [Trichonephila clavata]|uniref:Uncharacterized protein n=1 Tax=Trichonephila clavata TaxID=2740835 RepID=A0A8X6GWJ8_TRICU|nr:uncharacterized protein TNCT_732601 [Trichonephila clavata]
MYMEKLMHQIPMGKAVIETVRKNGQENNFMCMYAASKTIIQALMNVKQSKAIKSVMDMIFGGLVVLEKEEHGIKLVHPFQAQMTQQMKAISEYVVALLVSVTDPKDTTQNEVVLHSAANSGSNSN